MWDEKMQKTVACTNYDECKNNFTREFSREKIQEIFRSMGKGHDFDI